MSIGSLPTSWLNVKLGDVVDYGKTVKAEPCDLTDDIWVLELEDIEKDSSRLLQRLTFANRKSKSSKNRFEVGDVLYGKLRPYLNKVILADSKGVCSTEIVPLKPSSNLDNRYLFYWIKHPEFLAYVTEVGYGVNMPRLGTKDGLAAPFVLAPLAEQREIANRLDTLLAQVDTLKGRLDALPAILKRFRQSVLAAAVSGKLTEEWRDLESEKKGWKTTSIESVCNTSFDGPFGSKLKTDDYTDSGVRVARLENIGHLNFIEEKRTFISESKYRELLKNTLETDDILFSSFVDEEIRVCLFPKLSSIFINKADCFCLRVNKEFNSPKFIAYLLSSRLTYDRIKEQVHGATRPRINLRFLKAFEVNLPSLEEQTEIVRRVEQLFAFADQIEQRVKAAQSRVNHLTQSILAKAFRGELTADWREQHPELSSGEHSAEALLARIQVERAAQAPAKRTRKKKAST